MLDFNIYGDSPQEELSGFGVDISLQRTDSLDIALLNEIKKSKVKNLRVMDLGSGKGGQSIRLALGGCNVTAVDIQNFANDIQENCRKNNIPSDSVRFIKCDIRHSSEYLLGNFNYFYSQRTFHYIDYKDAKKLLNALRQHFVKNFDGKIFISVSGMTSELGENYEDRSKPIQYRFCQLSKEMRNKHKILLPVCLYELDEFGDLLTDSHYKVEEIYRSDFGNIKAIAKASV